MSNSFLHVHLMALRYFTVAANSGSMRQAANHFGVAASGVIRQLQKLEDQVQSKLFTRLTDGIKLTPAGQVLYRHVAELERSIEKALQEIDEIRGTDNAQLRIAADVGICTEFLIPHLANFAHQNPNIRFALMSTNEDQARRMMKSGDADIFLLQGSEPEIDDDPIFSALVPCGAIFSTKHRLSKLDAIETVDLQNERIIVNTTDPLQRCFSEEFRNHASRYRNAIEVDTNEAAQRLVQDGLGFQFRTPIGCSDLLEEGKVGFVRVSNSSPPWQRISLCFRPSIEASNGTRSLLTSLAEQMTKSSFSHWYLLEDVLDRSKELPDEL